MWLGQAPATQGKQEGGTGRQDAESRPNASHGIFI